MATSQMNEVIQHLRRVLRDGAGLTDGQLLEDYISRRDEVAFAALVRRHGPMVWGVCRRVLLNHHDAEDAFQATFLVLVRKAASIASRELLANWLYGVAHQTALKARATAAKRKGRERQVTDMPELAVTEQDQWRDLQSLLDEELSRLPDRYRGVIVLCDLEGKTRKEAAGQLGCPEGTVAGRLARARVMLAKRLTNRGVALSGGALVAVLTQQAVSAGVPISVVDSTIKAASLFAAGKAAGARAISVKVAALTEGVMKAMLFNKPTIATVLLVVGMIAIGASTLPRWTAAAQPNDPQPKQKHEPEKPAKKEIAGLAKEVVKMEIERLLNEKQEKSEAKKTIEDKEKIAQLLTFFPEFGTDKMPDRSTPRPKPADGSSYCITLHRMKGALLYIMISPDRQKWGWSEEGPPCNDDWNLNKPKEVGKFLDELLVTPITDGGRKQDQDLRGREKEKEQERLKREAEQVEAAIDFLAASIKEKRERLKNEGDKPPHIVEKTDMKGRMESGLPCQAVEDGAVVVKSFFAKMPTYPDIRFREFFDPRYLKKHGLTDRDIAFEIADHQGIDSLLVADDNLTVLVVLEVKGGGKEAFVMRCVVYEGHIYISPEKAPDPKTGIFKPWILRTKVK